MYTGLARKFIQVFPIKWYGKTHTNFLANSVPRKEITGLYSNSMFNFLRKHQIVLQSTVPFYISTSNAQWFQFLHILPNTCNFPFFFFKMAIPGDAMFHITYPKWCLSVVFICISSMTKAI